MFLDNPWIKKEIMVKIRTYFWTEWKENPEYQNVWYAANTTSRVQPVTLNDFC